MYLFLSHAARAGDVEDSFDLANTDWVQAKDGFAGRYAVLWGKIKIQDGKAVTAPSESQESNEILLEDSVIPDNADEPYTMSVDFLLSDTDAVGAVTMLFNYIDNRHFAYFRLRTELGKSVAQLILMKNGRSVPPLSEAIPAILATGTWYRLTIRAPKADEYRYEYQITEAGDDKNVVASGALLDQMTDDGPYVGGKVGFGSWGPGVTFDNFKLHPGS